MYWVIFRKASLMLVFPDSFNHLDEKKKSFQNKHGFLCLFLLWQSEAYISLYWCWFTIDVIRLISLSFRTNNLDLSSVLVQPKKISKIHFFLKKKGISWSWAIRIHNSVQLCVVNTTKNGFLMRFQSGRMKRLKKYRTSNWALRHTTVQHVAFWGIFVQLCRKFIDMK